MGGDYGTTDKKVVKAGDAFQEIINNITVGNRILIGPLSLNLANSYQLAVDSVVDTYVMELVDATGMVTGTLLKMEELIDNKPNTFYAQVISVATNTLTLDRPIDKPFTSAAIINREQFNMGGVNGSVTPVIFSYINNFEKPINIARIMFNMVTTGVTPYNGFGDIAAPGLTRGIELRKKNNDGTYTNYFNAKTNNRLDLLMFDFDFFDGGNPQAVNGIGGRFTFEKLGSPIILQKDEELQMLIQDNLTTILTFEAVSEGNREE